MTRHDSASERHTPEGFVAIDRAKLRYSNEDGTLYELAAADLAEALQGLNELVSGFAEAGAFGDGPPPRVMVRPPEEGSFAMEAVLEVLQAHVQLGDVVLGGSTFTGITSAVRWATKSARVGISDVDYLDNGKVKIKWQDDTADVVEEKVYDELRRSKRKNKRALRKILGPMGDEASTLTVTDLDGQPDGAPAEVELTRDDYRAVRPEQQEAQDEVSTFEAEAQVMHANLQGPEGWRVRTIAGERRVTIEDEDFLAEVREGRPISADEILWVTVREEVTVPNERKRTKWTITEVHSSRHAAYAEDDEG